MIRRAEADEHRVLTEISFASKKYWDYPAGFFEIWQKELTVSSQYILQNMVFVIEIAETVVGYYSLVELESVTPFSEITLEAGHWLDHMFILPSFTGKGLGRELFDHCRITCKSRNISRIRILADPNAKEFYIKMGCTYFSDYPSTIAGRTTPYLEFSICRKNCGP